MHFTATTSTAIYLALISGMQAAPHKGGFRNRLLSTGPVVPPHQAGLYAGKPGVAAAFPPPRVAPFYPRGLPPHLAGLYADTPDVAACYVAGLPPNPACLVGVPGALTASPGTVAPLSTPVVGAVPPLNVAQPAAVPAVKRHLADSLPADTPTVDLESSVEEDDLDMDDVEVEDMEMDDFLREAHLYKRRIAALYRNRVPLAAYAGGYRYVLPSRLARQFHA